jgi:hypothetical protein
MERKTVTAAAVVERQNNCLPPMFFILDFLAEGQKINNICKKKK